MVLLSSLLWWELGTSLPGHGPGEWLSFWRVTSNNSDSDWSPLLKVLRMVLLSSLLWWELGTNLPGHGPGEWLSFWRVISKHFWFCLKGELWQIWYRNEQEHLIYLYESSFFRCTLCSPWNWCLNVIGVATLFTHCGCLLTTLANQIPLLFNLRSLLTWNNSVYLPLYQWFKTSKNFPNSKMKNSGSNCT